MKASFTGAAALKVALTAAASTTTPAGGGGAGGDQAEIMPAELVSLLVRLRVLDGVPFSYVVPDELLLPEESIRFFYLDRNWTDALVQGLLSVGAVTTRDRVDVAARWPEVRDALDAAEHDVRAALSGAPPVTGDAEAVTGFLVRSRAISGWPGVAVRAYRRVGPETAGDPLTGLEEMRLLRLERLAPAVLLALVDGVPDQVHLEEPRAGIQFGVDEDPPEAGGAITAALKDPATGKRVQRGGEDVTVGVPFRRDSPGVVAVADLVKALRTADTGGVLGPTLGPAEYALQMLQLPYRQVFGETDDPEPVDDFHVVPTALTIDALAETVWRAAP